MQENEYHLDIDTAIRVYHAKHPEKQKLNKKYLSTLLGVNKKTLSDWQNKAPKSIVKAIEMCKILDCDINEIVIKKTDTNGK